MIAIPAGNNTALVGQYVSEKTGATFEPGMYQAFAILDDAYTFQGGVVISEFRDTDCQLSTAAETPFAWRDHVVHAIFDYVFNQLGCVRCTAVTKKSNKKARAFLEGLGFKLEGRIRRGFDGVRDALLYGLLREECTHIQEVNGAAETSEEAGSPEGTEATPAPSDQAAAEVVNGPTESQTVEFW